jgi:hypothetical protein
MEEAVPPKAAYRRRVEQVRQGLGPTEAPLLVRLGRLWRSEGSPLIANLLLLIALAAAGYW